MADSSGPEAPVPDAKFLTTHWSEVLAAQLRENPASQQALENLCRTYWFPLYAFVRRQGHSPEDAQDLTQEFFARLLEKDYLRSAAQEKGRFRTFLLVALKRFMANEWDRQHALKRGGFTPVVSIDQQMAEDRFAHEPGHNLQPDLLYDRQWAMTVLERALGNLQEEYTTTGRAKLFEALRGVLDRDDTALSYAEIAARLNLSEAAVKMAVYRLRNRYRELLRAQIAQTVTSPQDIEEEIQHLFTAFG